MADNLVQVTLGRKGSGKSTLMQKIAREYPRVFVIDTMGEYDTGFEVWWERQPCIEAMLSCKEEKRFALSLRAYSVEDNLELIGMAYEFPGTTLIVEETSMFTRSSFIPEEIGKLVRYGRHREINQFYVARRPSELSRDLTAQADLIVSFEQREPRDVQYLRDVAGDAAEGVAKLPKYSLLAFGDLEKAPVAVLDQLYRGEPENQLDMFPEKGSPSTHSP